MAAIVFVAASRRTPASHGRCMTITAPHPPPQLAPERTSRPRLRRVSYEPEPGAEPTDSLPAGQHTNFGPPALGPGARERSEAHHEILRILRTALEVLDRRRPAAQLAGCFAPAPLRCWQVAVMRRRPRSPARPGRMLLCMPRSGVAETALPCHMDGRVRARAARCEHSATGWRCTAIRIG
jgi:hypothetical protein